MRQCGRCTLCCTLLAVTELGKAKNKRCAHQGNGCGIYETRPLSCRQFNCLWLTDPKIPRFMRPQKSGVVLHALPDLGDKTIIVHQAKPTASAKRFLAELKKDYTVKDSPPKKEGCC